VCKKLVHHSTFFKNQNLQPHLLLYCYSLRWIIEGRVSIAFHQSIFI
jgi:hypothetical protein